MIPLVISGFDKDCKKLIIKFENESSVRFSVFASIWREMNFSLIFAGRNLREIFCFTNEALLYIKNFFVQTNSFLRKVCSIYILYGIYYKQPVEGTAKIMVTFDEWLQIKDFVSALTENNHLDALYITLKLINDSAFEFSAFERRYQVNIGKYTTFTNFEKIPEIKIDNLLDNLKEVENEYENIKYKLSESNNTSRPNYASNNVYDSISKILNDDFASKVEDNNTISFKPGPSTPNPSKTVAEKRKHIRDKSFKKKTSSSLFRSVVFRKTDDTSDDDDDDDGE